MVLRRTWIPTIFWVIIFYANYFYFIEKYIFSRKNIQFVLANVLLVAACIYANFLIRVYLLPPSDRPHSPNFQIFSLYWQALTAIITVGISIAVRMTQRWIESENARRNSENARLQSELTYLQYQLQPHFFFNSLNNIYSMVDSAPEKAKETIHSLAKLMRYMLYEAKEGKVPLAKEIEFLEKFIGLMEIRLPAELQVKSNFQKTTGHQIITPLLFLPLVENAFKHGSTPSGKGVISFDLQAKGNEVVFRVENPNLPKNQEDKSGSGIGLENLKKRLDLLYPGEYHLEQNITRQVYKAELKIKL